MFWLLKIFKKRKILKSNIKLNLSPVDECISYMGLIDTNLNIKWHSSIYNLYNFEVYFKSIVVYNNFLTVLNNYFDENKDISTLVFNLNKSKILLPDFFLDKNRNYINTTKEIIEFKEKALLFLKLYKIKTEDETDLSGILSSNIRKCNFIVNDLNIISSILAKIIISEKLKNNEHIL